VGHALVGDRVDRLAAIIGERLFLFPEYVRNRVRALLGDILFEGLMEFELVGLETNNQTNITTPPSRPATTTFFFMI
jgi:hypothetical protein